jgi:hypothetical protein
VHEDYGVGRYTGLTTMDAGGMTADFLVLEYAEGDKLYVPVQALERISRYTGAPAESAPLHKLGGEQWTKARARAAAKIRDAAAELLDVYARRAAREGHAFPVDDQQVRAFESGFPFEETVDQLQAIQAVIDDLRSGKPMDRVSAATSLGRPKWRCVRRSLPWGGKAGRSAGADLLSDGLASGARWTSSSAPTACCSRASSSRISGSSSSTRNTASACATRSD